MAKGQASRTSSAARRQRPRTGSSGSPEPARAERLPVRAVARAFDLLTHLAGEASPLTLSELARSSTLPISTVARLLATLVQSGLVHRNGDGRYAPGARLLQLGLTALRQQNIYDLAEPHLRRLSEKSGETANLAVRIDNKNAVYLRQVISPRSIHHAAWLGRALPLDRTAVGAALTGATDATGYVARRDTLEPGVTAVSAPVLGATGSICAALSITGPSYRISKADLGRLGTLVAEEARRLSEALGAPVSSEKELV